MDDIASYSNLEGTCNASSLLREEVGGGEDGVCEVCVGYDDAKPVGRRSLNQRTWSKTVRYLSWRARLRP